MESPTQSKSVKVLAAHLRNQLIARSGAKSAIAEIAADISDEDLVAKYHAHTALHVQKITAEQS